MACTEFEDVMQLLLSRGLWDVYHYNADEFVNDFVSLTGVVSHESLQALAVSYKEAQVADAVTPSENIGSAATRFLGRLWAGSNSSTKSTNLSPGLTAPPRPHSFLRRSPSKQSIASTLNSMEGGASSDSMLSSSTDATSVSRDSSNTDESSVRTPSVSFNNTSVVQTKSNKDKNLHGQIEDLLTALSEMQRDHAILATQLQREREEREEDRYAVRSLLDGLRRKSSSETVKSSGSDGTVKAIHSETDELVVVENEDETVKPEPVSPDDVDNERLAPDAPITADDLSRLLDVVEERFSAPANNRRSSMLQSKSQLREELTRTKEQLIIEVSKSQEFSRRLSEQQQEVQNLKDQVKEGHLHIRNAHAEKQRLEKQIHDMRTKKSAATIQDGSRDNESEWPARTSGHAGLRELKLGRANSNRAQGPAFNKRTSSLNTAAINAKENDSPDASQSSSQASSSQPSPTKQDADADALVLELVQAKTAEAIAKQEAEEAKAKLESLRKMLGMGSGESPGGNGHRPSPSQPNLSLGMGGYLTKGAMSKPVDVPTPVSATAGFWGGWGKRAASTGGEKIASGAGGS